MKMSRNSSPAAMTITTMPTCVRICASVVARWTRELTVSGSPASTRAMTRRASRLSIQRAKDASARTTTALAAPRISRSISMSHLGSRSAIALREGAAAAASDAGMAFMAVPS